MSIDHQVSDGVLMVHDRAGAELLRATGQALLSDGCVLTTLDADSGLQWRFETLGAGVTIQLALRNRSCTSMHVEQLRPLVTRDGFRGLPLEQLRIQTTGWQSWSRTHPPTAFEPNLELAAPPVRGPYLPHRRSDSQVEAWMTVLEPTDGGQSLLLGFLSARHQLGTIEIIPLPGGGHSMVGAAELDGVALEADSELASEPLLVAVGTSFDLVDLYARQVGEAMLARHVSQIPTGWCSWYQLYTGVSEKAVNANLEVLSHHKDVLPLRVVQVDDGYQHEVGDWLELNERFSSGMHQLVEHIRRDGFLPGLWLAPFLLSARSRTFAEHPDWVVRAADGQPLNAINNWGSPNYALDTTHPEALRWLEHVLRTVCEDWGYGYLKLDFLYAGAMRGRRFNRNATAVEAYRRGVELLRDIAHDRFILGCGAPLVSSIGLVDGMRIGADVAAEWGSEGNADGPSMRNAVRATLARLWMHGQWWINDPDPVLARANNSALSIPEVQAWASVVALSGGMLFASDDLPRLEPDRWQLLSRLLPPSGVAARLAGDSPERLHLRVERQWAAWDIVGLANWRDAERSLVFDPRDFQIERAAPYHALDLWTGDYLGRHVGPLDLGRVAPHSLRLLSVHTDLGRPQTIGGTGHVLGEAMDLATEEWDATSRTLTLVPRGGRGELVVYDPDGPLRFVSVADGSPIHLKFPDRSGSGGDLEDRCSL